MNVELLRASFVLVAERQPFLTRRFYAILFERHPELRALFGRHSARAQEEMLGKALEAVLENLESSAWLTGTLEALGAKHVSYGVTDEMYPLVGAALLAALGEAAGEAWTPELEAEWTAAFGAIAGAMQAGARRAAERAA